MRFVATATFGLEAVVGRELAALGYESASVRPGWVGFSGDASAAARANLWLRAADRVLLEVATFPASDFDALFEQTREVAWEELFPPSAKVPVRGRSVKSQLSSVPACQSIVKKAVVDRLRERHGVRELREDGAAFPLEVAVLKDEVRLVLDTTGPGLHKRGYRPTVSGAPLKETLAAGLVLLTVWRRGKPFLDPFCGTGTIAIEAALIARNRAPGGRRGFVSESWPFMPEDVWKRAREEARELELPPVDVLLQASDEDLEALRWARQSASNAGVASDVRFERRAFQEVESGGEGGCIVTNPPYGERLGEAETIRALYRAMPEVFRRFSTWSIYVLTGRRDFEQLIGQEASRRRKLFNGPIECTYYQFFGPRPGREDRDRPAFGGMTGAGARQAELFRNRVRKRARHLRKWPQKHGTDCYRIYEGDIKEVPLVVDRYGDFLRVAPMPFRVKSRTPAQQEDWIDLMARSAAEALGIPGENVVVAGRRVEPRRAVVREAGAVFEVLLGEDEPPGLDPGDRELRRVVREEAAGRRVIVLFAREGGFGVAAALGGASRVTLIEPSGRLLARARRNLALNDAPAVRLRFAASDAEAFLAAEADDYELAVIPLPPPEGLPGVLERLRGRLTGSGSILLTLPPDRTRLASGFAGWSSEDISKQMKPEEFRKTPRIALRLRAADAS